MPSTYSTSLKLQLMGNGDQATTWGTTTNTNLNLVEQAIAGVASIVMSNADYTLTNLNGVSDEARNIVLVVTGTNSAIRKVVAPLNQPKTYIISNQTTGGYAITIGASTGTYITIPNGVTAQVYTDGTNFYSSQTGSAGDFNVNGNLSVGGNLSLVGTFNYTPAGVIHMWPTTSAPSGFLLCNGTAVSRSTYAALFGVIGTTFGAGDGSTTFNLPNYSDRMPIGSGSIAASIGATGGAATSLIGTTNLPAHNHSFSASGSTNSSVTNVYDAGHIHNISGSFGIYGQPSISSVIAQAGNLNTSSAQANIQDPGHSHSFSVSGTTGNTGSNTALATISPYMGINFIIKT